MSQQTLETDQLLGLPVRTVFARVTGGPDKGAETRIAAETVSIGTAVGNSLELRDPTVSRYHAEFEARPAGIRVRDLGSTNGIHVHGVRISDAIVAPGTQLRLGDTRIEISSGKPDIVSVHDSDNFAGIIGRSPAMLRVMSRVARAANTMIPVLVLGESGTGKELVARALHEASPRREGPLVIVDCGAQLPALVASELFGHERGAFPGAESNHAGAFERAHGGTIFLDEIGGLPLALQATLLGVLERKAVRRVGGSQDIPLDVRIVCATNRDLRQEVNAGQFRLDLYYRIAVASIVLPPLRERTEDIDRLVEHFVRNFADAEPSHAAGLFEGEALRELTRHHWPGNVRELRNYVESTLAMAEFPELDGPVAVGPTDLHKGPEREDSPPPGRAAPTRVSSPARAPAGDSASQGEDDPWVGVTYKAARAAVLGDFERSYLQQLLHDNRGNVSASARSAKMDRSHLMDMLKKHGMR